METINQRVSLPESSFDVAQRMMKQAWQEVDQKIGKDLDRTKRSELLRDLRQLVLPPGRRGRKLKPTITAAVRDLQGGLTGEPLYEKYIPGWNGMNQVRRNQEAESLESAIRTRLRRDQKSSQKESTLPAVVLENSNTHRTAKSGGRKLSELSTIEFLDDSEIELVDA